MISKRLERLRRMMSCLDHQDKIHIRELVRILEVSEMTVRRDLNSDYAASFGIESYGGYVRKETNNNILNVDASSSMEESTKLISELIFSDDVVFFDNGKYHGQLIDMINEDVSFTGVTTSLSTFMFLKSKPHCKPVLLGGNYDPLNDVFISHNNDILTSMVYSKSFFTPNGLHDEFGATVATEYGASVAKSVLSRTIEKYVVCSNESIDTVSTYSVCEVGVFDYFISFEHPLTPMVSKVV
ncbi:DeoR/GlpR family DNA-binding transcription regulator [Shewanella livingstonensis]|uniref:DeoR/GlpR transcriptional regulator n=1 Tax=Shewanella livingstonensis TaxID=150120 RepID=A0A3G8LWC8_9GAMM|nr:DeoR/GlpR transcriptional regulator [Shewanella livingstonensis]